MNSISHFSLALMLSAFVLRASNAANVLRFEASNDVVCPEGGAVCEGPSSTCCRGKSGEWSCCPFKDGQCCSDGAHCCPAGSTCDVSRSVCLPLTNTSAAPSQKGSWPPVRRSGSAESSLQTSPVNAYLPCPGGKTTCPLPKSACCRDYVGRYACCNSPYNVCCDDGQHCCLSGTVCDPTALRCIAASDDSSISWTATSAAAPGGVSKDSTDSKSTSLISGDETEMLEIPVSNSHEHKPVESMAGVNGYCPDGTVCYGTCCLQSVTPLRYGCCPYVYATCCPGGTTCCAAGYRCFGGKCIRSQ